MSNVVDYKYPSAQFIRGISTAEQLKNGQPYTTLFKQYESLDKQKKPLRSDGKHEMSITWYACQEAYDLVWNQINDRTNDFQFKIGVTIVNREKVDLLIKEHKALICDLSYEPKKTEYNKYHGNLLIPEDATKEDKMIIAAHIALSCIDDTKLR